MADDDLVGEDLQQVRVDEAEDARGQDRDEDDRDRQPIGAEERDDPAERLPAALLWHRLELAVRHAAAAHAATGWRAGLGAQRAAAPEAHLALCPVVAVMPSLSRIGPTLPPFPERCGGNYQAVAVTASAMPSDASQRSASIAALQPSPAAVTAWR